MKKYIYLVAIIATISLNAMAQKGERLEAMKIGFITERLNLSSDEAKIFWPVYNKFTEDLKKLRQSTKGKIADEMADMPVMTDTEAEKVLNDMVNFKINEADLLKKYATEFKKVLPVKKVVLLFKAENDFKRELLKKLAQRNRD
jgi:poly(A) polymerase Pap1